MVLFGPARMPAIEQPTVVESQVVAIVWFAHGRSLMRADPEHLVDCSPLVTTLFGVANPDAAILGASRLRDLIQSEENRVCRSSEPSDRS